MNIVEIDGHTVTLEFNVWELSLMGDMARLAEVAIESHFDLGADDPPPHLQHREDLQLIAGLWKSLCRVIGMSADRHMSFSQWRYQELRYLASRAMKRGEDMAKVAEADFPDEALFYQEHQEKIAQSRAEAEYTPRTSPRPTNQQAGEVKGEDLDQLIGTEQVEPDQITDTEQVTDDTAPSEGGAV